MLQDEELSVSVIAVTMRQSYMDNVLRNYDQQTWSNKELIVILNDDEMDMEQWEERAAELPNVKVYWLPQKYSLGKCLNWGVEKAKGDIIAKFDDDDYYAPMYLQESMNAFHNGLAPIIGKYTVYVYFEQTRQLMVYRADRELRSVRRVKGGTILFRRYVWNQIKFAEDRIGGSDSNWLKLCHNAGFPIYSVSKEYYVCVRREDLSTHTQKRTIPEFMERCTLVEEMDDYIPYILAQDHARLL